MPGEELTTSSRAAAIIALVLAALTVAAAVYSSIANFPRGLILALLLIVAAQLVSSAGDRPVLPPGAVIVPISR